VQKAIIYVDGQPYAGVDPDGCAQGKPGMSPGWEGHRANCGRDVLLFGGEPHIIEGAINLQTVLTQIVERLRYNELTASRIVIDLS